MLPIKARHHVPCISWDSRRLHGLENILVTDQSDLLKQTSKSSEVECGMLPRISYVTVFMFFVTRVSTPLGRGRGHISHLLLVIYFLSNLQSFNQHQAEANGSINRWAINQDHFRFYSLKWWIHLLFCLFKHVFLPYFFNTPPSICLMLRFPSTVV